MKNATWCLVNSQKIRKIVELYPSKVWTLTFSRPTVDTTTTSLLKMMSFENFPPLVRPCNSNHIKEIFVGETVRADFKGNPWHHGAKKEDKTSSSPNVNPANQNDDGLICPAVARASDHCIIDMSRVDTMMPSDALVAAPDSGYNSPEYADKSRKVRKGDEQVDNGAGIPHQDQEPRAQVEQDLQMKKDSGEEHQEKKGNEGVLQEKEQPEEESQVQGQAEEEENQAKTETERKRREQLAQLIEQHHDDPTGSALFRIERETRPNPEAKDYVTPLEASRLGLHFRGGLCLTPHALASDTLFR